MTISPSSSTNSLDILASFADTVPIRTPTAPEPEVTIPVDGLDGGVRLAVDAAPGCGGIAWPAGEVLSNYLAYRYSQDPDYIKNKTIVELGSGTGLVGLVAGLLEPEARIWITDQVPLLPLMRQNVALNFPDQEQPPVVVCELDWGVTLDTTTQSNGSDVTSSTTTSAPMPRRPNMVLAADCVYFEPAFPLLVSTLCELCPLPSNPSQVMNNDTEELKTTPLPDERQEILFCWKKRRKADARFFKMLHKHFSSSTVMDDKPGARETYERQGVKLMKLTRIK